MSGDFSKLSGETVYQELKEHREILNKIAIDTHKNTSNLEYYMKEMARLEKSLTQYEVEFEELKKDFDKVRNFFAVLIIIATILSPLLQPFISKMFHL